MQTSPQHYLCDIADLKSSNSKSAEVNGVRYVLLIQEENIFAYINECPHLKIPLDWGNDVFLDPEGDLIQCATHGALFTINNGECIYGPCLGKHLIAAEVHIANNKVFLA